MTIARLIYGTGLSILVFFSISFLTVLPDLNSPMFRQTNQNISIGFPLTYYSQFSVDCLPHSSWVLSSLLIDAGVIWAVTIGGFFLFPKGKSNH